MVEIVLTAEQVRNAPREVKDWLRTLIDHDCAFERRPVSGDSEAEAPSLAVCSEQHAAALLEQIRSDYIACQIFFELGRDDGLTPRQGAYHRIALREIMRHVRLQDPQHLVACLDEIDQAFRRVSGDADARLFAFDDSGNCYIREETHQSVKKLFQALMVARLRELPLPAAGAPMPAGPSMPISARPDGFAGGATAGTT